VVRRGGAIGIDLGPESSKTMFGMGVRNSWGRRRVSGWAARRSSSGWLL